MQSLAKDLANFGKEQGKHIAAAKAKLKSAKAGVEAARKVLKEKQGALTQAAAQKDAAGTERQSLAEQQEACELAVQGTKLGAKMPDRGNGKHLAFCQPYGLS